MLILVEQNARAACYIRLLQVVFCILPRHCTMQQTAGYHGLLCKDRALSLLVRCGLYVCRHRPQDNMTLQGYCIGAVQSNDNKLSIIAQTLCNEGSEPY